MAEHLRGRNHTVHVGNGCTSELLHAWLILAEGHGADTEMAAVRLLPGLPGPRSRPAGLVA